MIFAISLVGLKSGLHTKTYQFAILVEAINYDEAKGISSRLMDYLLPESEWPNRNSVVSNFEIDPGKPFDDQLVFDGKVVRVKS